MLNAGPAMAASPRPAVTLVTYLTFVKPHIDVTFVLVAVTGGLLAGRSSGSVSASRVIGVVIAAALMSAGAECFTNIIDCNIDAVMPRTARRALPTGAVSKARAATLGAVLTAAGLALAGVLGLLPFIFLLFALVDNVVVYSALTKRSTPWSIVLGSAVGPLTLWAGFTAVTARLSMPALLIGAMVGAWVPVHIWAIATRYGEDYIKAAVPMAPVVWSPRQLAVASTLSTAAMGVLAVAGLSLTGAAAAAWVAVPVAALSLAATVGALALPWHRQLALPLTHFMTAYLVVVLVGAIALSA